MVTVGLGIRALCCVLVVLAGVSSAQQLPVPSARQLLVQIPSEVPGIEVHHTFPGISHPQQIVAGEDVTTLFTVRNTREQGPVNVTFISGSIANPLNYKVILDNFTVTAYRSRLDAGNEQSFEYTFRVHPAFPSREFRVALTVFYNDMSTYLGHATTFFNQTIEVVEAEQLIDTQLLGLLGYLALALGAIGWGVWGWASDKTWYKDMRKQHAKTAKSKARDAAVSETSKADDMSDYLTGTAFAAKKKEQPVRERKKAIKGK